MYVQRTKKLAYALRRAQDACLVAKYHEQRSVTLPTGVLRTILEQFDAEYLDDPVPSESRRGPSHGEKRNG